MTVAGGSPLPRFPFVIGSGRSGTTLLRAMLDSHSRLAIPHESYFLLPLIRRRDGFVGPGFFNREEFLGEIAADIRFGRWGLPIDLVRTRLATHPPGDVGEAIHGVFAANAEAQGKDRYGDKTPSYALAIPSLAAAVPGSCFIHIVRDGRDVALSYRDTGLGTRNMTAAACRWRRHVGQARQARATIGDARYLEIRYEDLARDPEVVVRSVCAFIDIDFEPMMLEYRARASRMVTSRTPPTVHDRLRQPPTTGLRDWRKDLIGEDLWDFESVAGPLLAELGYEVTLPLRQPSGFRRIEIAGREGGQRLEEEIRASRTANKVRRPYGALRQRLGKPV